MQVTKLKKAAIIAMSLFALNTSIQAQDLIIPRSSSNQTVTQKLGTSDITINYSRPNAKGRTIFGTLVPYGEIWRTGADKLTDITIEKEVSIAGHIVAPGRYSIMTIPNKNEWTVILNSEPDLWGPANHNPEKDIVRFTVVPQKLKDKQETLWIGFENVTAFSADWELRWDDTKISFPITINQDKEIEKAIADGKKPYVEAAIFYLNNNKDLKKPLEWMLLAEKDVNDQPYIFYWKAMVQEGLGMKIEALESVTKSLALAEKINNTDYIRMSKALIKKLK